MLHGDGVFSDAAPFHRLLDSLGRDRSDPAREQEAFVARSFLLDEGVSAARRDTYLQAGGAAEHAGFEAWRGRHEVYLRRHVFLEGPDAGPPTRIELPEPEEVPETFRDLAATSPFALTDGALHLVRMVAVSALAGVARVPDRDRLLDLGTRAVSGDAPAREQINDALDAFARRGDLRPVFAAWWEDVQDLFGETPGGDVEGWADELRDRLGLLHYAPSSPADVVPVFVLRYPAALVPEGPRGGAKPLVVPSVLDGGMSPAFFPSPAGEATGHTVYLGPADAPELPCRRELLHPAVRWRAEHLWRVGELRRPVADDALPLARGLHILEVREAAGRPAYAAGTDGDLL